MGELKTNAKADAIGYLYRAADAMARGDRKSSLLFFETFKQKSQGHITADLEKVLHLKNKKLAAEKMLDEYKRLFFMLPL